MSLAEGLRRCRIERRTGTVLVLAVVTCGGQCVISRKIDFRVRIVFALGEPVVPVGRTVHIEGKHVAGVVTHVVGRVEYLVEVDFLSLCHIPELGMRGLQRGAVIGQHHLSGGVRGIVVLVELVGCHAHHGLGHEVALLGIGQTCVLPIVDDIVQVVGLCTVVHLYAIFADGISAAIPIGIEVGLHIEQHQLAMRAGGDGERDLHLLLIGRGTAGIGRHYLVVDVDGTLDKPVVSVRVHVGAGGVLGIVGIAVVDDGLARVVDEVTRGLYVRE